MTMSNNFNLHEESIDDYIYKLDEVEIDNGYSNDFQSVREQEHRFENLTLDRFRMQLNPNRSCGADINMTLQRQYLRLLQSR
jgi:hypothetical protein